MSMSNPLGRVAYLDLSQAPSQGISSVNNKIIDIDSRINELGLRLIQVWERYLGKKGVMYG